MMVRPLHARLGSAMLLILTVGTFAPVGLLRAADIGVVPMKLIVVDKLTVAGRAKTVFVARDAAVTKGSGVDPEQISVQLGVAYGDGGAQGSFVIPAGTANGWVVNKASVAKYVNKNAPAGPTEVKVAVVKQSKQLKLVGKGLGDTPLDVFGAGDPAAPVFTAYCVNNEGEEFCHCSGFTGCVLKSIAADTGAKLVCKEGTPDLACQAKCGPSLGAGRFVDQGLTVLDTCTNLEWEKKDTAVGSGTDAGNLHDVDNRYQWAGQCTGSSAFCQPNAAAATACAGQTGGALGCDECGVSETCIVAGGFGTTVWEWLSLVNTSAFAGHSDWRLATSAGFLDSELTGDPPELESIVDLTQPGCGTTACIASVFGPTVADFYASASTYPTNSFNFAIVNFLDGDVRATNKVNLEWVRAVRPEP